MAKVVVTCVRVSDVETTVTDCAEINVCVVLALLLQVVLHAVFNRDSALFVQDNNIYSLLASAMSDNITDGVLVDPLLHDSDRCEAIAVVDHRHGLGQHFLRTGTSVEEHTESVALLDRGHVCVFQNGNSSWLLGQELHGGASHSKIAREIKFKFISHMW